MSSCVTVIDYGVGNLLSVSRAFEHTGADVLVTDSPSEIDRAERLVLPGVGAFKDGMQELTNRGLIKPIKEYAGSGRPFLGICLGMQMMLDSSEEFGEHEGLGIIKGKVVAIPKITNEGASRKIPHIGWNRLMLPSENSSWQGTILEGLEPYHDSTYFVHSFFGKLEIDSNCLATCEYDSCLITAAILSDRIYGCQFHPEKSANVGLKILENFCQIGCRNE